MPEYQANITYKSGFYNSQKKNGIDDRTYTAEEVRKPYDVIYSDGIKPDADGTPGTMLQVTSIGGMAIAVAPGHAKVGGAWFENTSPFRIGLDVAGATDRYDCVILRNDDNENVRAASIYIKSLEFAPDVSDLERNDKVYEMCLAYVRVPALSSSITAEDVYDSRDDGSLCNVMSGVGATVVRTYRNTYFTESANQSTVPIGIPQYKKERDSLTVIVEGRVFTEGVQYELDAAPVEVNFVMGFPVIGTRIDFEVTKNVNAAGADTVVQEVAELRKEMTVANKKLEHLYFCNGINDNIIISDMAQQYINGGDNLGELTISLVGTFGATNPYSGAGTSSDPYIWLALGNDTVGNRRVALDFAGCNAVNLTQDNAYYYLFGGIQYTVKNLCLSVVGTQSTLYGQVIHFGAKRVYLENCIISATVKEGWMFNYGTFRDCEFTLKTETDKTAIFRPMLSSDMIRVYGGEHLAYTSLSNGISAVVYCASDISSAVIIADALSCPTKAVSGYRQTHAVYDIATSKYHTYLNLITELPINATSQTVRDTIVANK